MSQQTKTGANFPFISVITPVYNDPKGLKDTLESLVVQDYSQDKFEVIVADNGSTDSTPKIADEFMEKYPDTVKLVVENTIQSSYAARNKGIEIAKGSILAFIDADMTVEKDWLSRINASMDKNQADYLGCNVKVYSESKSIYSVYNIVTGFPVEEYVKNRHFAPTCCLVVRKSVFEDVGLFDFNLISGGDYEFGMRVYQEGKELHYSPEIVMKHPARSSFKKLMKKSFRIGRGFYQLSLYHPDIYKSMRSGMSPLSTSSNSWKLFTFGSNDVLWKSLPLSTKFALYMIDFTNKAIKPVGYIYEKYRKRK